VIPFNKPYYSGKEGRHIEQVLRSGMLTGDIKIISDCEELLQKKYGFTRCFLSNSCSMALEMAALLIDTKDGDEIIMPSYTYVSTANAFALHGAKIVFADSSFNSPCVDALDIKNKITPKTKAIVIVHYAGIACDMEAICRIAEEHDLWLIEDAAHCIDAYHNKKPLGSIGHIGCFSFHETKNIHCGEGGFIAVNDAALIAKAEIIRNKGTNRTAFTRGEVNKYEWVDLGYSASPSGITAGFLFSQLCNIDRVTKKRKALWNEYHRLLKDFGATFEIPELPEYAGHNAHIFYLVCADQKERDLLIKFLKKNDVQSVFHYQTLHLSPFYLSKEKAFSLPNAERFSNALLRLPLFYELGLKDVRIIAGLIKEFYKLK
jgi:dTDP-4-amino-4,6-dideoxygalactose transaminase